MADDDEKLDVNVDGLEKLARVFKKIPTIHVGILGDGNARATGKENNATIGARHEFGTTQMPQRSFLRVPLIEQLDKRLKGSGVISKKAIEQAIKAGTLAQLMRQIGIVAEDVVLGGFDSGGYGKWAPLKPATLARKKNHQTLVETQQLRNSITSEVVDGEDE